MTTFTLDLPDETAARLRAAAAREGLDPNRYAAVRLAEVLAGDEAGDPEADAAEVRAWWDGLSEAQREAETARTRASLAAADAGRTRPADEVYARIRARYTTGADAARE